MSEHDAVSQALHARHAEAQRAFAARDIAAYRDLFAPTLAYQQPDGRVIGRDQLMRDVATQFARLSRVRSSFRRLDLALSADGATETLAQVGELAATAFGIIHRRWRLERRGAYSWVEIDGRWVIARVRVDAETMSPAGWSFGLGA
jgi:hypothetical protein